MYDDMMSNTDGLGNCLLLCACITAFTNVQ